MSIFTTATDLLSLKDQGFTHCIQSLTRLCEFDTPLSVYRKLVVNEKNAYLLESVEGGETWGRYSIIGLPCQTVLTVHGEHINVTTQGELVEHQVSRDPLAWIEAYQNRFKVYLPDNRPRFVGGLVGYFGYETIAYIEPKLQQNHQRDLLNVPDIALLLSEEVAVVDNINGEVTLMVLMDLQSLTDSAKAEVALQAANDRLQALLSRLDQPLQWLTQLSPTKTRLDEIRYTTTEADFKAHVDKIKDYILSGDVFQAVLSQRMIVPFEQSPFDLYRALRHLNPSPYLFYFDLLDFHIVGSSPEILVRHENQEITVRPIAGTRPRGKTPAEDLAYEADLLADPKELAEHLMLIDLGRNDVGRLAKVGQVRVSDQMIVERYSHVMHIVSNVVGQVDESISAMDALRATFPAGTLSGAPKIRAMEVLHELEPIRRGIYGGAVGYVGWDGSMDVAIAIRTGIIKDQQLHLQAGAGIVADSDPDAEWQETLNKAMALIKAMEFLAAGMRK